MSLFVCGSRKFIAGLYECLDEHLPNFKGKVILIGERWTPLHGKMCHFGETYRLNLETNDTRKLGQWMYDRSESELRLKRKHDKFLLLGNCNRDYKRKAGVKYGLARIADDTK